MQLEPVGLHTIDPSAVEALPICAGLPLNVMMLPAIVVDASVAGLLFGSNAWTVLVSKDAVAVEPSRA